MQAQTAAVLTQRNVQHAALQGERQLCLAQARASVQVRKHRRAAPLGRLLNRIYEAREAVLDGRNTAVAVGIFQSVSSENVVI